MAGVDSGIKVDSACCADISALEKRALAFVIMQIGKPEGGKIEKVLTKFKLTTDEVKEVVAAGSVTVGDKTVEVKKESKPDANNPESDTWCVFRQVIQTFPIAYGSCFVDYKTKDGRDSDKLVYVTWNPDNAGVKDKMKYSSTKVLNKFSSTPLKHQASDSDDITFKEITDVVRK